MGKQKHRNLALPALAGAFLLAAVALLCLTVFALRSLSAVRAEDRLSQASAHGVEAYYRADREAQELLARIRVGELPDNVSFDGDFYTYECPISESQALAVEIFFWHGEYMITRWQSVPTAIGNGDENR